MYKQKGKIMEKKYHVNNMSCSNCQIHIEKVVKNIKGVKSVTVSLLTNSMVVEYDESNLEKTIKDEVRKIGYSLEDIDINSNYINEFIDVKNKRKRLIISLIILLPLMYISMGHIMWGWYLPKFLSNNLILIGISEFILALIILIINKKFFINGIKSFKSLSFNMDTLVSLGSGASFIYSTIKVIMMFNLSKTNNIEEMNMILHNLYFESSAMILTLITVGKMLEAYSKGKTTNALKDLMKLKPKKARVLINDKEEIIDIKDLKVNDIFIVKPGEKIAADGIVIDGESNIDEAMLTGESIPVYKERNSKVSEATINLDGTLYCKALDVGKDTTYSKIVEVVENMANSKAPISKTVDKVANIFVPLVIIIAFLTALIWYIITKDINKVLVRMVSVLIISCPCSLGLATPTAIMVGSGISAKNKILFKNAYSLESCGKAKTIIIDKTGTLTKGIPEVTDIIVLDKTFSENEILIKAASLENLSDHPFAKAIVKAASNKNFKLLKVENFQTKIGKGIKGDIDKVTYYIGNRQYVEDFITLKDEIISLSEKLANEAKTPLYFINENKLLAIIGIADNIKDDAIDAINELYNMGLNVVMLTGDNKLTAKSIASKLNIKNVISNVLPNDKADIVKNITSSSQTIMVGDGINDAIALLNANVGISISTGSDIAINSSDIVLMKSNVKDIVKAIKISKKVMLNIKENLFWAFFYNIIAIPIAAGIFKITLNPMIASIAMSLSSFCVVMNALRLNLINFDKLNNKQNKKIEEINISDYIESKENNIMEKLIKVDGMMCMHCVKNVKNALEVIDGIIDVNINLDTKEVVIKLSKEVLDKEIEEAISKAGYQVIK